MQKSTESQSALQIIKSATIKEKLILIYACTFQFIMGLPFAAIPFWQMNPKFICNDASSNSAFTCSAAVACSEKYRHSFTVDTKGITKSIVIENQLYCEKQSIWANSQTLNMMVILIMTIIFLFKKVQLQERYKYILISQAIFVMASFLLITVTNLSQILLLIAVLFMSNQSFYLNMYPFINAHMNKQLQTIGVAIYNVFYALSFGLYPLIDYFVQDWKKMMLFVIATPVFLNIIYVIYIYNNYVNIQSNDSQVPLLEIPSEKTVTQDEEKNEKKTEQTKSKFGLKFKESQLGLRRNNSSIAIEIPDLKKDLLQNYDQIDNEEQKQVQQTQPIQQEKSLSPVEIIKDKYLLQVTVIFIILILSTGAAFIGSQFCINMLPVDVYSISIVLGIAEAGASLYSAQITAKFPIKNIIQYTSILIAITLLPFYFQDINNTSGNSSSFSPYIFFLLYVIGKTAMFVCWAFAFILLFQCTTSASQGSIIAITQLVQMTVLSIIPQYNQMLIKIGINPVASYALFSIVASFAVKLLKDKKSPEEEQKKQSLKQMKNEQKLQQIASASTAIEGEFTSAFSLTQSNQLPLFAKTLKNMSIEMTPLSVQSNSIQFQQKL